MSTPITATYVDPLIAGIRSSVNQKTDAIPFLLMPVRIETRFMQVTSTSSQVQPPTGSAQMTASMAAADSAASSVESTMEAMGSLNVLAVNTQTKLSGLTLRAVTSEMTRITAVINGLGTISIKEKGWLKQVYNGLEADVQSLARSAGASYVSDSKQLSAAAAALKKAIQSTAHEKVRTLPHVTRTIESAAAVDSELATLTGKREQIPYLNIKNKKDLYIYITKALDKAQSFYRDIESRSEDFSEVVRNQGSRLGELHRSVQSKIARVKESIADLHSDRNWKAFVEETVGKKVSELQASGKRFTDATLPRITSRPQPRDLQAGDLVLHGVQTLVKIKRFNARYAGEHQDEKLQKFRAELQPRIDKLNDFIRRPIHGATSDRKSSIQRLYGTISSEVNAIGGPVRKPGTGTTPGKLPNTGKLPKNDTPPVFDRPADPSSSLRSSSSDLSAAATTSILPENSLTALNSFAGIRTSAETEPQYVASAAVTVNQLWVRIYPDDVFIRTHEEYLTLQEIEAGRQFWKTWWAASNDADLEMAAWRTLCTALGTKRASWVARQLDPMIYSSNGEHMGMNKPSFSMTDATSIVNTVNTELKKIDTSLQPGDLFLALQQGNLLAPRTSSLQQALTELNTVNTVQAFLWEKLRGSLVQTASVIGILIEKSQALTAAQTSQFATTLTALQNLVSGFNAVQNRVQQIQAIDDEVFVSNLVDPIQYPEPNTKPRDWSSAPGSNVLPDRFVVVTVKDGVFKHIAVGNPVPANLQLGLDPAKFTDGSLYGIDANGNLNLDPGLKWMVDYPEAVAKGMGITLTLDTNLYNNGIDKLIVVGVKNTDALNSKQQLEKLLQNHIYSADGMSFLKTGTPTNNTQEKKAGYAIDDDVEQRFNIEIRGGKYNAITINPFLKPDGKYFSEALGITNGIAQYANDGGNFEIANALAMNRSLWSATMGHYLEELWDALFPYDNIRRAEKFFTSYVTGRGIVPSIRIGMQPYGILTTTAFSQLQLYSSMPGLTRAQMQGVTPWDTPAAIETTLQTRFEMRLHHLLNMLRDVWTVLSNGVIHSGNLHAGDPQQRFVSMLGLHATSLDYFYRYSLNVAKGPNMTNSTTSTNFSSADPAGPTALYEAFKQHIKQGVFFPSFNFKDEDPAANPGVSAWKIIDQAYSRIKRQIEGARLFDARHIDDSFPVLGSLVDTVPASDSPLSILPGKNGNYIDWLLGATANELLGGNQVNDPARIPTNSMLFLMLRQSLLQAYQESALNMLQKEYLITEVVRRESGNEERYFYRLPNGLGYRNYYLTKWHYMLKNLGDLIDTKAMDLTPYGIPFFQFIFNGPKSVGNYIDRVRDANPAMYNAGHQPFFDKLKKVREGIGYLKRASTSALEILMAEHVDITSYRLDAWLLGLAHQRLQKQRAAQPEGIFLGAYGYVENLKRDTNKQTTTDPKIPGFKLPAGKPVYKDPDNDGLIHAPSQNQAIAAAVLRNAYRTNTEAGDVANRLAVNLTSARVRMALKLIEGIRNGQEVGALLGFQFERGLHDRYKTIELDKFIQPFRKAFPLQQHVDASANGVPAYVSLVVNGQAMLDLVYSSIQWLGNNSNQAGNKTVAEILKVNNYAYLPQKIRTAIDGACAPADDKVKIYNAIIEEIDRMADAFDAMGDLAVSESVYQIVQGNHVRAAAVLTALADGKNIPDPQIIETQRNGTLVTQRVLLNFNTVTSSTTPPGWTNKNSHRYLAEPSLNNWLGLAVGDPTKWMYLLKTYDADNKPLLAVQGSLAVLGWQPIDFFELPGGEDELKELLISEFRRGNEDYTSIITLDLKERYPSWQPDVKTIPELFVIFKRIRNMLSNARIAGLSDLKVAGASADGQNPGNFNVVDLETRVTGAFRTLELHIGQIEGQVFIQQMLNGTKSINDFVATPTDMWMMHMLLTRSCLLGIPGALSYNLMPAGTPEKRGRTLMQHLLNILKQAKARYQAANEIAQKLPGYAIPKVKVEKLTELAKAVLGKSFLAIPSFGVAGTEPITAQLALPAAQAITRHGGVVAVEDWLQHIARIRKRLYDTQMYLQMSDVYDMPVPSIKPVQLTYKSGDYWLGIEYPSNYVPDGDKLSLVMINESVFRTAGATAYSSLIIDEWVEIIPNKEVTSGIVFNYNQPNAAAPQSMLLAVTPNVTNRWDWDDLVYTVIDTMALAKIRAVEPDHLENSVLNHVLPGIASEVAPPSLRNQDHNPLGVQVVMDFADVKPKTV